MEAKKQMRYSDDELALIRNTFGDEDLLKDLRKFFWGDKDARDVFKEKDVLAVIKKTFLPDLDSDAPISQIVDLWLTLNVKDKNVEDAYPFIVARSRLVKYFTSKINALEDKEVQPVTPLNALTSDLDDIDEAYINLIVRSEIIAHIEQQLQQLQILSSMTMKDLEKKLKEAKNSTK